MIKDEVNFREPLIKIYDEINTNQIKSICFTSSSSQEGTTTIATALAKTVASLGKKVIYCDFCDFETSLSKKLNTQFISSKGTVQNQLNKNIYFIETYGFYIIPPPQFEPNSSTCEELNKFLELLKKEYDLILIDSNYFLHYSTDELSTNNLCQIADATVLVVLSGKVTQDEIKHLTDKMKQKGIKIIGFVMNDINYPKLVDELYQATHCLDSYFPKISEKLREWLKKSSLLKIKI